MQTLSLNNAYGFIIKKTFYHDEPLNLEDGDYPITYADNTAYIEVDGVNKYLKFCETSDFGGVELSNESEVLKSFSISELLSSYVKSDYTYLINKITTISDLFLRVVNG